MATVPANPWLSPCAVRWSVTRLDLLDLVRNIYNVARQIPDRRSNKRMGVARRTWIPSSFRSARRSQGARGDVCGQLPLVLCRRIACVMAGLSGIPRRLVCPKSGTEGREIRRTERASLRLRRRNFDGFRFDIDIGIYWFRFRFRITIILAFARPSIRLAFASHYW